MAGPPAKTELEALEEARAHLEAALAGDEAWRALRQPFSDDAQGAAAAARRARNVRLEKALAGNELYKAWKHLNQAINTLRSRRPEAVPAAAIEAPAEAEVEPQPEGAGEPGVGREPRTWTSTTDPAILQTVKSLPGISESLMRRLAEIAPAEETFTAAPPTASDKDQEDEREQEPQRKQAQSQVQDLDPQPVAKDEYDGLFDLPEPPEATVTFVVREGPRSKQA
ncbi:MAG: hypothetical protein AB7O44_03555 [Hyphomicrobiaceae bacterium]